jgi:antitoxin component YwqK of YwqJK toxin-antitoxin module
MLTACRGERRDLTRPAPIEAEKFLGGPDVSALTDGEHKVVWQGDTLWVRVKDGLKQGYSKSFHANGAMHRQGSFTADLPDGWWEERDSSGVLLTAGEYRSGVMDGRWRFFGSATLGDVHVPNAAATVTTVPRGTLAAEGAFVQGTPRGYWRYFNATGGVVAEGDLAHGAMNGWWRLFDADGVLLQEGHFDADVPNGHQRQFKSGLLYEEGNMAKGRRTGTWTRYDASGAAVALDDY